MFAATYNLTVDRASTWSMVLTLEDPSGAPINYTSVGNFTGHVRLAYSTAKVAQFTFTTIGATTNGQVAISLLTADTLLLTPDTEYQYDVFLNLSSVKTKLLTGSLTCRANITR
jgi:hypothetical protein